MSNTKVVLLTTAEAAELLNAPIATLRWWRHKGVGPRAFRMGERKVMYKLSDVEVWLDAQYSGEDATQHAPPPLKEVVT